MSEWNMPSGHNPKEGNNEYVLLPKGNYTAVIERVTAEATSKGTDYIEITLKITEGEHAGRLVWAKYYYTEKAIEMLWDMLCNIEKPELAERAGDLIDPTNGHLLRAEIINTEVAIYVNHDEYEGKTRAKAFINGLANSATTTNSNNYDDVPF